MQQKDTHTLGERNRERLERIADVATRWIGSTPSLAVHTLLFITAFALPPLHIVSFDKMLLVLTTIVSLEAIYLAIFIQMSVNKNSKDIEEIQEDVEEIQEDIEEIQEDVEEIQEDVEELQEEMDDEPKDDTLPSATQHTEAQNRTDKIIQIQELIIRLQQEVELLKSEKG
ncbi:DUF1003 domain-containing protein [Niabella yanshanensis]|uniref:DUF1003 domain-containing protein n=1 Tax=Niabella yanshanensis TaxID=577386 RepID=A0ABZ0W677_9BACT|nr:DUF1003 domain-containing protein [Niabella yanshanensis]WQD38439.1 DUF1003 domain-containing protein [Niabella yanshanensis]